ncbi:MAG: T9SS type A sorting domain-containing protein [Flavobacteriales bacterium]|nr:T9SS type A sorting domain-containing protein [Flavobacteriales bacterium]
MLRRIVVLAFLLPAISAFADWDIFQSYAIIDFGDGNNFRAGGFNADGAASYNTYHYGFFRQGDTFTLNGGELKTFKNGSSNVCGGSIHYRVYKECETPGAFASINLPFESNLGGGDQRWQETAAGVDLLNGLTKGDYVLEIFWEADGNQTNPGGCGESKFDSNFGGNFLAYFTVGEDGFEDGDFTNGAVWSGDTGSFSVLDATSLSGDGANGNINNYNGRNADVLVSNASTGDAALTLPSTQAYGVWEFSVATGDNWLPSNTNNFAVILMSDDNTPANLQIGSLDFNGYFIKWKSDPAGDSFGLFKQEGMTETELIDLAYPLTFDANLGYTLKVVRTTDGDWTLYADQGFDNVDASTARATVRDNDITSSSYFAVSTNITNASDARRLYFDNLLFGAGTEVSFASAEATVEEADMNTTYDITVNINDEDDRCGTDYEVVLISGDATRIDNYTTQSLSFAAGDNTAQTVSITINGNDLCEEDEDLIFGIQNVSGGCDAMPGLIDTFTLHLEDDESGKEIMFAEDFEDGNANGWSNTSQWDVISSVATIGGSFDLRHTNVAAASDFISHTLDNLELRGVETTWRFNIKNGGFESSSNNWLMAVIVGSEEDAWSATLDGYAVGINFDTPTDNLRLVRIDNGAFTDIVTSSYDWNTNITLGIEVVRDENGNWELKYQENGGFDAMTSAGTANDTQYVVADYFSYACQVTVGNVNKCRIDDISVVQYGCFEDYYSVGNGNSTDAIWSLNDPMGAGTTAVFGRFKNVIIQNTNTVTLTDDVIARNLTVENGGTLNGASGDIKVYVDWTNDGSFDPQTGSVTLKGAAGQNINGTGASSFYNLRMDNRGTGVTMNADVNMTNIFFPDQGTLDVNGNVFTLLSDASGTASIGAFNDDSDLTGNITMQRHIPAGEQSWANVGAPLTGLTIADWNDDIITTGFPGSDFDAYPQNNIQKYDESVNGGLNDGWEETTGVGEALLNDRGYMILMLAATQDLDMTGGIQKGDISQPISYNPFVGGTIDGWNLVANRYPSEIDWDALANASPGVSTYYVYDAESASYLSRNGITQVGTAPRYIAPGQSFWVKADAAGASLEWSEAIKSSSGQAFERSTEAADYIELTLSNEFSQDAAYIGFLPEATTAYENDFDAYKLGSIDNGWVSIASLDVDGVRMGQNTLPSLEESISIPLQLSADNSGTYALEATDLSGIPSMSCVTLEDTETGEIYVVNENLMLEVALEEDMVSDRFIVHLSAPATVTVNDITCFGANDAMIEVNTPDMGNWTASWYDELDNLVLVTEDFTGTTVLGGLGMGNYKVVLSNDALACEAVETVVSIDEAQVHEVMIDKEENACNAGYQGWIQLDVDHADIFEFTVTGDDFLAEGSSLDELILDELANGTYTVEISSACIDETHEVVLIDADMVTLETNELVTAELIDGLAELTLVAEVSNADLVEWTVVDGPVATGEVVNLEFTEEGEYEVHVVAYGGECSTADITTVIVDEVVDVANAEVEVALFYNGNAVIVQTQKSYANAEFNVYSVDGKLVYQTSIPALADQTQISTSELSNGTYLVEINANGQSLQTLRFVK